MNIVERISFKIPLTILKALIIFYARLDQRYIPERIFIWIEGFILKLGAYLAFSRIKAFDYKPHTDAYSVYTLLPHKHVYRYVINLQSLLRFAPAYPRIVVCDDGTLTANDQRLLTRIPRLSILPSWWLQYHFYLFYNQNPTLAKFRDIAITTRKTIDLVFLKDNSKKTLMLDCDVGFMKYPVDLFSFLHSSSSAYQIMYIEDIQDAYSSDRETLAKIYKTKITPKVNTGLVCFKPGLLTKSFIEHVFSVLERNQTKYQFTYVWTEQTPWAILTKRYKSAAFPPAYHVGRGETPIDSVCRHYVYKTKYYFIKDLLKFI